MELPANIAVEVIVPANDKLYLFKNKDHLPEAPKHYHIAIPTTDSKVYVLLVFITSQYEKKEKHYNMIPHSGLRDALIKLSKGYFSFLTKDLSIIDCNNPIFLTREELASKIDGQIEVIKEKISDELIKNIITGIKNSPEVKPIIKDSIKL